MATTTGVITIGMISDRAQQPDAGELAQAEQRQREPEHGLDRDRDGRRSAP